MGDGLVAKDRHHKAIVTEVWSNNYSEISLIPAVLVLVVILDAADIVQVSTVIDLWFRDWVAWSNVGLVIGDTIATHMPIKSSSYRLQWDDGTLTQCIPKTNLPTHVS